METLLEVARTTNTVPRALLDRPPLNPRNRHLLEAFYEVSAGRSIGEVPQPLRVSELLAYCQLTGVADSEERERLLRVMQRLDGVYLRHAVERQRAESRA